MTFTPQLILISLLCIAIIFLVAYILELRKQISSGLHSQKDYGKTAIVLPLKLKAYERLIIFMERMKPNSMVMRLNNAGYNSGQLQLECLKSIRDEFEHNLSMQMYISESTWRHVKAAKEETLELIKIAGTKVAPNGSNMDLAKAILALEAETKNTHLDLAINLLKAEIKSQI